MFIKKGPGSSFVINIFLYNICVEWALLYVITNNVIPVTKYNFLANFCKSCFLKLSYSIKKGVQRMIS